MSTRGVRVAGKRWLPFQRLPLGFLLPICVGRSSNGRIRFAGPFLPQVFGWRGDLTSFGLVGTIACRV